jgi:formate dehydrogenase major subunit
MALVVLVGLPYIEDGQVVDVEGDPESPINEGTLCPKGADIFQNTVHPKRLTGALYRRPYGDEWQEVDLEWAMDRIAERVQSSRDRHFVRTNEDGRPVNHTRGVAFLGGAALDNEENYVIKKLFTALGAIQVENQARI